MTANNSIPTFEKPVFFGQSKEELLAWAQAQGLSKFILAQVFDWIYKKYELNPDHWTNVSKKTKALLFEHFSFELPRILWTGRSKDGTQKFLLGMGDQQSIEAVVIPAKSRRTLCLSTQVGCAIGCTFCHTGTQGLKRHLKPHEIIGQWMVTSLWLRENFPEDPLERLTNIVYMGQGEPLHNFENTKKATILFMDAQGINLGQRKITLSTSGLVPQIEKLGEFPPVNIAISLHASHDKVRSELMPINKVYDLKRLFEAIQKIPLKAHRRITYEYLLIDNLNMGEEDLEGLMRLIDPKRSKINLIPFNEYPGSHFKRPSKERIFWFNEQLNQRGYTSTVRTTKGTDILAACGQLKSEKDKPNLWEKPSEKGLTFSEAVF